jgi:hypothetical protein
VSSLVVYPRTVLPKPTGVWLVGSKRTFYPAGETCGGASYPHLVHNDNATFVDIYSTAGKCQLKATIFQHSDFKGKFQTSTSSFAIGKDLHGKASSLKIEPIGKCAVRTQ